MCEILDIDMKVDPCFAGAPGTGSTFRWVRAEYLDGFPALQDYAADQVANKPYTLDGNIALDTTGYPSAVWNTLTVPPGKHKFDDADEGDYGQAGTISRLKIEVPGNDPKWVDFRDRNRNVPMVVQWSDKLGQDRVMGNNLVPCLMKAKQDLGEKIGDANAITLEFECASGRPAPFYEGTY